MVSVGFDQGWGSAYLTSPQVMLTLPRQGPLSGKEAADVSLNDYTKGEDFQAAQHLARLVVKQKAKLLCRGELKPTTLSPLWKHLATGKSAGGLIPLT